MSSESGTTVGWLGNASTSNLTDLFDNGTALGNETLAGRGGANAILAADTIKIIYLVIGQFT